MKRLTTALMTALLLCLASTAIAGDGHGKKGKKSCKADAQTCLNKLTNKMAGAAWDGIWVKGIKAGEAVVVKKVDEGSPGATAGIQAGDVLVAMNKTKLADLDYKAFNKVMASVAVGEKVTYKVKRGESWLKVPVTMTAMPKQHAAQQIGYHMMAHAKTTENVASY